MFHCLIRLFIGIVCGYLVINWLPDSVPVRVDQFFAGLILNPVQLFAGIIAFLFGVWAKGGLYRKGLLSILMILRGNRSCYFEIISALGSLVSMLLFLHLGTWQTSFFFSCCLFYGILSFIEGK